MRLYAVSLILKYFAGYANCITSASSSLNSSNDNEGTHKAISSSDSFPIFIILSAVSLSASCLSLLINDFIICSSFIACIYHIQFRLRHFDLFIQKNVLQIILTAQPRLLPPQSPHQIILGKMSEFHL